MNLNPGAQDQFSNAINSIANELFSESVIPNEMCIGRTPQEAQLVADILARHRNEIPDRFKNHTSLAACILKYFKGENAFNVDWSWFQLIAMTGRAKIRQAHPGFELISLDRYLITQSKADQTTGFSGKPGGGYYYMNDLGFSCVCSGDIEDRMTRAVELARNYLHDSLHRSTFKSFRLKTTSAQGQPEIYRYDYGINKRLENGESYSSADMTDRVPDTINLNILMDGANYIYISQILHSLMTIRGNNTSFLTEKTGKAALREIFKEVLHNDFDRSMFPASQKFYNTVIKPSQMFIDHWQERWDTAGTFQDSLISSLFSGDRGALEAFFIRQTGNRNAWEDMFKQPGFVETGTLSQRILTDTPDWHSRKFEDSRMSDLGNLTLLLKTLDIEERHKGAFAKLTS